jgi:methylamine--corrinoid protein Co-methyltransferase
MISFIDVLDRAHDGPYCDPREWDKTRILAEVKQKLAEHGLNKTCNPQKPINTDDGLANEFWKAGFEMALDLGMLCLNTERVIKFDEDELKDAIRYLAPSEITLGDGADKVVVKSRKPEDTTPTIFRSGYGIVSEETMLPLLQGIAQQKAVDLLSAFSSSTLYGRPLRAVSPYETLAGINEASILKEATRRANRPGMPCVGLGVAATEYALLGGYGAPNGYNAKDIATVLAITELKTSYSLLHKVAKVLSYGGHIRGGHVSMIGGYVGPPEGAAIGAVAATILQLLVHRCSIPTGIVYDIRYSGNVGRDAIWANSVADQAVNLNTKILTGGVLSQVSGPCTYEILYEMAAGAIEQVVSGCTGGGGNRPAGGVHLDHASPLEQKFMAEVVKSSVGMKRSEGNEILNKLLPKYENKLKTPSIGKSFAECYDIRNFKPSAEWKEIYANVSKELLDLGLSLQG